MFNLQLVISVREIFVENVTKFSLILHFPENLKKWDKMEITSEFNEVARV